MIIVITKVLLMEAGALGDPFWANNSPDIGILRNTNIIVFLKNDTTFIFSIGVGNMELILV